MLKKLKKLGILASFLLHLLSYAQSNEVEEDKFVIQGDLDLKTSEFITNKMAELKEKNDKIRSEIYRLQDRLVSKSKDKIDLNIAMVSEQNNGRPQFGVIQLTGLMNNISLIRYDHPLLFESTEKFPLFDGALPLGQYIFKVHAIVGQQLENWPFILPEGKWSIEKSIHIDASIPGKKKNFQIILAHDNTTGLPQFEITQVEDKK